MVIKRAQLSDLSAIKTINLEVQPNPWSDLALQDELRRVEAGLS